MNICRGVPKNTCKFVLKLSIDIKVVQNTKSSVKENPVNYNNAIVCDPSPVSYGNTYIDNSVNNGTINNNNFNNTIVFNGFGREDVSYLTSNIGTDNRIKTIRKNITDTMDLVHFNADHPENQTVRKLNKKSDLIEFRTPDNTWEYESEKTGLKKLQLNLEQQFRTKFDDVDDFNRSALSEILYHKTQRGGIPEDDILSKYDINDPKGRRYIEEKCAYQVQKAREAYFRENEVTEATAATGTVWMQRDLRQIENVVREKYALPLRPEIKYTPAHLRTEN